MRQSCSKQFSCRDPWSFFSCRHQGGSEWWGDYDGDDFGGEEWWKGHMTSVNTSSKLSVACKVVIRSGPSHLRAIEWFKSSPMSSSSSSLHQHSTFSGIDDVEVSKYPPHPPEPPLDSIQSKEIKSAYYLQDPLSSDCFFSVISSGKVSFSFFLLDHHGESFFFARLKSVRKLKYSYFFGLYVGYNVKGPINRTFFGPTCICTMNLRTQ